MNPTRPMLMIALMSLLACQPQDDRQAAAQAQAAQAEREQAAQAMEAKFEAAIGEGNWRLAKGYAEVLQTDYPNSAAAARVRPRLDEVRAKAEAQAQQQRLAALWSYAEQPVGKDGQQRSASIYSKEPVDTDGSGAHPVRLIFRDHPAWGRSAYLVLQAGDFDCYKGCRLTVTLDGKAHVLPGLRPKTDEAIAMFIEDWKGLWRLARSGQTLAITFPTRAVGRKTAVFEVGGLDPVRMPGWPQG
ncbi:hypothetical protein [Thermomonas hydrothermalis]|uniref:Lipoprotein n=1 Tax=Thermomonas hydrothermalis TaxID=213588 RepID=A0A1M4U057_9GAMM|nr:hypothetical protein [Thermomonas hydrothermalis]SHE49977.1 hypothetical protein SAMN02745204_00567 [Thermomonas hydrothermalis]